jgi:hypothetical protein
VAARKRLLPCTPRPRRRLRGAPIWARTNVSSRSVTFLKELLALVNPLFAGLNNSLTYSADTERAPFAVRSKRDDPTKDAQAPWKKAPFPSGPFSFVAKRSSRRRTGTPPMPVIDHKAHHATACCGPAQPAYRPRGPGGAANVRPGRQPAADSAARFWAGFRSQTCQKPEHISAPVAEPRGPYGALRCWS